MAFIRRKFFNILKYWGPPLGWMLATFYISTDEFSGDQTGSLLWRFFSFVYSGIPQELFDSIHFYLRKTGHFVGYAIFALLLFRAFKSGDMAPWRWKWAIGSLFIAILYAMLDEFHQTLTRHRVGSLYDSLLDTSGAFAALFLLRVIRLERQGRRGD